uniref:Amine oxidase domain-containing protein n=1 Tax=Anabas testudineus TaxID=64144 RepID=A0A7N6AES9_ANATE
ETNSLFFSIFVLLFTLFNSHNVAVSWKEELPDCLLDKDYKKLLYIVENGLPPTATSHHVVIGGAGVAGLTAAKLLHDAGHKVTILEASGRIGGRVDTYRNEEGLYAELGAMRIPTTHKIVLDFNEKHLGVTLNEFRIEDNDTFYLVNGKKVKEAKVKSKPDILNYSVLDCEKGKSADKLLQYALKKVQKTETWMEYLKEEGHLSSEAVRMIGDLLYEDILMYTELSEMIYDQTDVSDSVK